MTPRLTTRGRRNGWAWAVAGSSVVHACLLAGLAGGGARLPAPPAPEPVAVELTVETLAAAASILPVALPEDLPGPSAPTVDEAGVARPIDAPEGERDTAVARTMAPRVGEGRDKAAPAADR